MNQVVLTIKRTDDGRPVQPGDLLVLHVPRKDVVAPNGWTANAARGAAGQFFWKLVHAADPSSITLWSPSPEPFQVDSMALWMVPASNASQVDWTNPKINYTGVALGEETRNDG